MLILTSSVAKVASTVKGVKTYEVVANSYKGKNNEGFFILGSCVTLASGLTASQATTLVKQVKKSNASVVEITAKA